MTPLVPSARGYSCSPPPAAADQEASAAAPSSRRARSPSCVHPAAVAPPAHDHGGLSSDGPDGQRRATSGDGPGTRADFSLLPPGRSGGRDAEIRKAPAEQRLDLLLEQSRGQLEPEIGAVRHGTEGRYVENPNAEVIAGLREAADWLEAHPELYRARGLVSFYPWGAESREALTTLAAALGERATERVARDRVFIEAEIGDSVRIVGDALVEHVGGTLPAKPRYTPIIKPCPECRGAGGGGGYSVRGLPDPTSDWVCDTCEGSGRELF